jgi:hypothetical protein
VEGLSGQGRELFGRREVLSSLLNDQLPFLEHVHELGPGQRRLCGVERFEPQPGASHPLDGSMVLFDHVLQIFHLPGDDVGAVLLVVAFDSGFIGLTAVDGNGFGDAVTADRLRKKAQRRLCIPVLREQKVNGLTVRIYRPREITLLPLDPNMGLIHPPTDPDRALAAVECLFQL